MRFQLYILECADGTYYTGIATDVDRRIAEHNGIGAKGKGARYTASRRPVRLVYRSEHASRSAALKAELGVKRLSRDQKQRLIAAADVRPAAAAESEAPVPSVPVLA